MNHIKLESLISVIYNTLFFALYIILYDILYYKQHNLDCQYNFTNSLLSFAKYKFFFSRISALYHYKISELLGFNLHFNYIQNQSFHIPIGNALLNNCYIVLQYEI